MLILDSTRPVVEQARYVTIDDAAITEWAQRVPASALKPALHGLPGQLPGTREQLANLVLLIDALNFCFWSDDPIEIQWRGETYRRFEAMFVSLLLAARYDPAWFDPQHWVSVASAELRETLSGKGELLLLEEREQICRETGQTLIDRFDGQFANAVESVNEKAWPLAVLLMTNFDAFRDVASHQGRPVYFMKRAQICALDLAVAWQTHGLPALDGLEELTAFADYRVPQALRHLGILGLEAGLAGRIDAGEELAAGSETEVEMRAASVQAVERMRQAALASGKPATAWQIDWYLWKLARDPSVTVEHHRTRTIYY